MRSSRRRSTLIAVSALISLTFAPSSFAAEPPATQPPQAETPSDAPEIADPNQAYQAGLEGAQTIAVAEAQKLVARVRNEREAAQQELDRAAQQASQARARHEAAEQKLQITQETAARTAREIENLKTQSAGTQQMLGEIARKTYQKGNLSTVSVVLAAETPTELTDRYVGMRALLRAGDTTLSRNAISQADLREAQKRLAKQVAQEQEQAKQAAEVRTEKEAAEQTAQKAQTDLEKKTTQVNHALDLAEDARIEDYRRYMALINESTAIGERLVQKSSTTTAGNGTGSFVRPGTGRFTSEYGPRRHPILGYVKIHTGLDFGRGDGNIYAADAGTVVEASFNSAYGNMVIVDHGQSGGKRLTTMYAHQSGLMVSSGQKVEKGQLIGRIGSTGYSTGPHLHFEVRLNGQHTDPRSYVAGAPAP